MSSLLGFSVQHELTLIVMTGFLIICGIALIAWSFWKVAPDTDNFYQACKTVGMLWGMALLAIIPFLWGIVQLPKRKDKDSQA